MSNSSVYEFEDTVWDEFCRDDHVVPHPGPGQVDNQSILGDSHNYKKPFCEVPSITRSTGNRSAGANVSQTREQRGLSTLSSRSRLLDQELSFYPPTGLFPSSDRNPTKEISCLTSDYTRLSSDGFKSNKTDSNGSEFCKDDAILREKPTAVNNKSFTYPLGEVNHTDNNLNFFEKTEDKDFSDLLYDGWPEMGNFDDIDMMFRSCDSTFGFGISREDDSCSLLSAYDTGGAMDISKSDHKSPSPKSRTVQNMPENHDSSKCCSASNSALTNGFIKHNDSWASETDPYVSFVNGPVMAERKDEFIHKQQGPGENNKDEPKISSKSHSGTINSGMINEHKEMSPMTSDSGVMSLGASCFRQLQLVMEQLDLRTKLCIKESLYRLAQSADGRHAHVNLDGDCGDERDSNHDEYTDFMDMETDTNRIDRSIAHLLFYTPSEPSAIHA